MSRVHPPPLLRRLAPVAPIALLGYVVLAFALTAPVWSDPTSSWPGTPGDPYKFIDFLAWIPHQLGGGHNPLFMQAIDYPRGVNLSWETPLPLAALLTWPVTASIGPIAAYNVWIVLALALDGWCTFLWIRRHTRSPLAAFIAGAVVEFGPFAFTHAYGHLNIISFFPVPLLLIAFEELAQSKVPRWRAALVIGALFAVQLYLAEEIVALTAVTLVIALFIASVVFRRQLQSHLRHATQVLCAALVVFLVLAAPMLLYQFLGPLRVTGAIHPFSTYVTDLANLVIPTNLTLVNAGSLTTSQVSLWTGERDAYVGLPLLALSVYAAVRWRKEPLVLIVASSTLIIEVLSFGSRLTIGGHVTFIRLPGVIFAHLPVLDNLLPGRFSLIACFGFALLLAITLDRTLFRQPLAAVAGSTLCVLSVVFLLPAHPLPAATTVVPPYFTAASGARALPPGTVALVGPYIDDGVFSPVVMLWQAESDFHFTLVDGDAIHIGADGQVSFFQESAFGTVFTSIQASGVTPRLTPQLEASLFAQIHDQRISRIIIGPMPNRPVALSFIAALLGAPGQDQLGVTIWSVG